MSRPCAILECKRVSRALCYCCQQNLCRDHLNEHDDLLNSRLNPIADEVNILKDRINNIDRRTIFSNLQEQLNQWRTEAHRRVDSFYDEKRNQINTIIDAKLNNYTKAIDHIRITVKQLIDKQETTVEDLNTIEERLQIIRGDFAQIEDQAIDLRICPLDIDDKLIEIDDENTKQDFDISTLTPAVYTINRSKESYKAVSTNNRTLLMHHDNQLCLYNQNLILLKKLPWNHEWIRDICWSSTISRYFLITLTDIFTLDETSMSIEQIVTGLRHKYRSCTCSNTSFYVTTDEFGSSICEYRLQPQIELICQWRPADLCRANEMTQDIAYHNGKLAFIIANQTTMTQRMELRVAQRFEPIWSVEFNIVDQLNDAYHLCLFNYNEWIVTDWRTKQLFHITNDGQIKSRQTYDQIPYRCCQFGSNLLAISAKSSLNFHRL